MQIKATLNLTGLNGFPSKVKTNASKVVRVTAFRIQEDAQLRAPVDYGAMKASVYTITDQGNGYADAIAAAKAANPKAQMFDDQVELEAELSSKVVVGAEYAGFVHDGTAFRAAQPFFYPCVDDAKQPFQDGIAECTKQAAEDSSI